MFDIYLREILPKKDNSNTKEINKRKINKLNINTSFDELEQYKIYLLEKTNEEIFKKSLQTIHFENKEYVFNEFKNLFKYSKSLINAFNFNKIIINPTYGLSLNNCICGDGDYIIDGVIIDCKTTIQHQNSFFLKDIRQQLVYHMLNVLKKYLKQQYFDLNDEIQLMYIRFNKITKYKLTEIMDQNDYTDIINRLLLFLLDELDLNNFDKEIIKKKDLKKIVNNLYVQ